MTSEVRGALSRDDIEKMGAAFAADPKNVAAMNAVTKTSVRAVAMSRRAVNRVSHTFSHTVKTGEATSQASSGRCWMFAGLNTMRMAAADDMNLEQFELSQSYAMFWDKLEKANFFLESILSTLDEPTDGRLIAWLLANPVQDGGQWDMFVNVVHKYGVVPKTVMPETESSSSSGVMNERLTMKLREDACMLRKAHAAGESDKSLRARKPAMIEEIHRILTIHLGEPPAEFLWQWRDKDKEFHRDGVLTPQQFREKRVPVNLEDIVCLINCPQASKAYNTTYTVDHLGNVVGGQIVRYLNVESKAMKAAAIAMIRDGRPVWFGCDVGKTFDRDLGVMDVDLYNYDLVYGLGFGMNKAERLDYGDSQMTHAMVLTGVDLDDDGRPLKWRVENSWGDKGGDKGFMIMTDRWFDEYNYEVAIDKKYLPEDLLRALEKAPIHLPPWDPMGALAR